LSTPTYKHLPTPMCSFVKAPDTVGAPPPKRLPHVYLTWLIFFVFRFFPPARVSRVPSAGENGKGLETRLVSDIPGLTLATLSTKEDRYTVSVVVHRMQVLCTYTMSFLFTYWLLTSAQRKLTLNFRSMLAPCCKSISTTFACPCWEANISAVRPNCKLNNRYWCTTLVDDLS